MHPWLQLAASLALAALGAKFVSPGLWFKASGHLVPVLSIIAAAVLFRLGRGLPPFEVATLSAAEVRRVSDAYRIGARNTAAILIVLLLALCSGLFGIVWSETAVADCPLLGKSLTFIGIALNVLAVMRTIALVQGDLSLIRLQAELLEESIRRQHTAVNKVRREHGRRKAPVSTPRDYGGLVSPDSGQISSVVPNEEVGKAPERPDSEETVGTIGEDHEQRGSQTKPES